MGPQDQLKTLSRANRVAVFFLNIAVIAVILLVIHNSEQERLLARVRDEAATARVNADIQERQRRILEEREGKLRALSTTPTEEKTTNKTTTTTTAKPVTTYVPVTTTTKKADTTTKSS
jgi:hypothetical protein